MYAILTRVVQIVVAEEGRCVRLQCHVGIAVGVNVVVFKESAGVVLQVDAVLTAAVDFVSAHDREGALFHDEICPPLVAQQVVVDKALCIFFEPDATVSPWDVPEAQQVNQSHLQEVVLSRERKLTGMDSVAAQHKVPR